MLNPVAGPQRWLLIDASPEAVFAYLADLPRHGEWDAHTGFRVVRTSDGPTATGSFCERERMEIIQASILRGGAASNDVSWIKRLVVTECEQDRSLAFETKNLYNGLSIGSETVSFRLFPEGTGTVLVMSDRKNPHVPGLFHVMMLGVEKVRSAISRPLVGLLFRVFPALRSNGQLSRIKRAVEGS